ncbi:uncharacterized protein LOC123554726 isoform X1 [Mercenaria mercenaria]|uniref:uncharacterized protein LOC123554726 isoform X1 n=1 Tax=Mercenaria mercenaria TaxID=6596 RepID=UPI00234F43BA|nr:uncharacterized protein LOC123554726 isoform X1 [Mercenaria mercenaria]
MTYSTVVLRGIYKGFRGLWCSKERNSSENIIRSILGGVAVLLLALTLLVGSFISFESEYSNTGYRNKYIQEFSFLCDDLSLSPDEDFETFNINKNKLKYFVQGDKYICRFHNLTEVLYKVVQRVGRLRLSLGLERQPYLQCGNSSLKPASGYLTATFSRISRHQKYKDKGFDQIIHWDKHLASGFFAENLKYKKGKVRVPEGRFYFVYASVHINVSRGITPKINTMPRVSIRICVNHHGHERTLLYKSNSFNTTEIDAISTLNVGSHVYLAREEDVYVRISDAKGIMQNSCGNSFGIFPLY